MTDTNQLPEPELGYIKTDKSNQPAFSARQMRDAMQHALQARAQVQGEAIGEVGTMPGTSGFTMACFRADEVPVGTKLYTTTQPAQATQAEVTDKQILEVAEPFGAFEYGDAQGDKRIDFARAILSLRPDQGA